jgi:hypothetical protein
VKLILPMYLGWCFAVRPGLVFGAPLQQLGR